MASVPSEKLERGINAFRNLLTANSSYKELDYSCAQSWTYSLKQGADGGPKLADRTVRPEHIFWECSPEKSTAPAWRLKATSNDIVFNYVKNDIDDSGSWEDFRSTAMTLIPILKKSLDIPAWKTMVVTYFFTYSIRTIDDRELAREEWIEVRKLLQPFASMPHSDDFDCFSPTYLWEQSWLCKDRGDGRFRIYSKLGTNRGRPEEPIVQKGNPPLEIQLFMSAEPSNALLKEGLPWDSLYSHLKGNYLSMLTDESRPVLAGDFK